LDDSVRKHTKDTNVCYVFSSHSVHYKKTSKLSKLEIFEANSYGFAKRCWGRRSSEQLIQLPTISICCTFQTNPFPGMSLSCRTDLQHTWLEVL